jgi:uncharacterized phage infection (PIP) family protein YhgE
VTSDEAVAVYDNGAEMRAKKEDRSLWSRFLDKGSAWITAITVVGLIVAIVLGSLAFTKSDSNSKSTNSEVTQLTTIVSGLATTEMDLQTALGDLQTGLNNHTGTLNAIKAQTNELAAEDADIKSLVVEIKREQTLQVSGNTTVGQILKEAGLTVTVLESKQALILAELSSIDTKLAGLCASAPNHCNPG